jgi:hypothetical protein
VTLLLLLLSILPHEPDTLVDRVEILELSHVHCPLTGREPLTQMIYWRWHEEQSTHRVAAWRLVQGFARIRRRDGEWIETREDGQVRREIHARQFRETWTFEDPELLDRRFVSQEMRRGLKASPSSAR